MEIICEPFLNKQASVVSLYEAGSWRGRRELFSVFLLRLFIDGSRSNMELCWQSASISKVWERTEGGRISEMSLEEFSCLISIGYA